MGKTFGLFLMLPLFGLAGCGLVGIGCGPAVTAAHTDPKPAAADPPASPWNATAVQVNQIDDVRSQTLETGQVGSHIVLYFQNGKLASKAIPIYISAPCFIEGESGEYQEYKRQIRLRYDQEKPASETWGISDDHRAIFPRASSRFLADLQKHRTVAIEFGCDRSDSAVMTYQIDGLKAAADRAGLKLPN